MTEHRVKIWRHENDDWRFNCSGCDLKGTGFSNSTYAKLKVEKQHNLNGMIIDLLKVFNS